MRRALLKIALIAGVLTVGAVVDAQVGTGMLSKERSLEVQGILAGVEANRGAAVDQWLRDWQANLGPNVYNIYSELGETAKKAPAWQLLGAALPGDFQTAVQVLRGHESAGKYINALAAPQEKVARGFGADQLLGDATNQLVFTPIAPCRVVDTRNTGARTGLIPANGTRTFDLTTDSVGDGQGGTAGCPGLPSFSHLAWSVNITVTNAYVASGGVKAWGFNAAEPNASVINFGPAVFGGIANGLTLTGCLACVDDITIRSFSDATHVIIDVMGYYEAAPVSNAATTRVIGTVVNVPANGGAFATGGTCPAGTSLISGELDHGSGGDAAIGEFTSVGNAWRFWFKNNTGAVIPVTPFSRCIDTPIQQ